MGSTQDLLQTFSSAESRSLGPECSNGSRSFRPKLLSRSLRDRSTFFQQQNLNQKTIPISRVVECCLSLDESTCFLRPSGTTSGEATSIRSNTILWAQHALARYGYWKIGSGHTFCLVFLEEAALKITFVRVKTLTVLTVLQGKKKKTWS